MIYWFINSYYDVVLEVNRDQTMLFVDHVNYDVLSKVILDQAVCYVVHVDYYVFSEINCDQARSGHWVVPVDYEERLRLVWLRLTSKTTS